MIRATLLLPVLVLAGCATGDAAGPSLGRRAVEATDFREPERSVAAPAPAGPQLAAELAGLRRRAEEGEAAFATLRPRADAAAARAGAEGSEAWVEAQQLLSALEAARQPSTAALARLDTLLADRLLGGQDEGTADIQALQAELGAMVETQQRAIDRVRDRISR